MGLHLGLTLGNAQPVGPESSITIDTAPTITGTAEVGETLTRTVGSYSGDGTITVSNGRWTRNGVDIAPAQTGATYTLDPTDDEATVRWYEDVADAGSGDTITAQSNGLYVTYAAPVEDAAPTASGDAVIGESLTGTSGTFTGSDLTESDEWEVSDDGATGWTGTGDTDTTSPAQVSGKHYRFASTASNSGGTLTTYSSVIGPAIAPTITMAGLTSGDAIVGDHASITMSADVGTITARKWGSTSGGSQFGTGTNPTDYTAADGGTLYATATVGGIDYTVSADVLYTAPAATGGLSDQSFTEDTGAQTYDVSGDFTNAAGGTWSLPTTIAGVTINSSGVVSFNTDTLALQTGTSIVARYTNSGGSADSGFSLTITEASSVATLSFDSAGPQETDGDVPISYTISANDTVELVLFAAAEADPDAADFDGGGAPTYIDLGPASLTTGGSAIDVSIPSDLSGSYKIAGLPSGGGDVDVAVSAAFTVDTVASVLSGPTDAADGETASTGSVSTNEGDGTLYWVITQSATSPSAAQIQAGNDHTGTTADDSGSQAVSGTGAQNMAGSGLTASTGYYTHFVQVDSTGNVSNVASASGFTTTTPDVTAPTLSSPTAAKSGETGATSLGVSTNEGNGTLYWGIYPTASTPSAADVVAGTGATVNGSQAVSGTGVQSVSDQTGLTAATAYKAHYVQDDAATNRSSVATSSEFTTDAAASDPAGDILTLLGAKVKALYDATDFDSMKQNTGGSTAVTAAGQAVRYLEDLSGNGNHATAKSGNALSASGYLDWNDAEFIIAATGDFTSTSEVYALVDPADDGDNFWMLLGVDGQSGVYLAICQSGSGSSPTAPTPTPITVDNVVQSSPTRGTLHTAMTTGGGYKALGASGVNLSSASQVRMPLSYGLAATAAFGGRAKLFLICDALTAGERSDLQDIFSGAA